MSRSKRAPYWTDGYGSKVKKSLKRDANKTIRNKATTEEVAKGKGYKKLYESWNIMDYKFYDAKSKKVSRK